MFNAGFAFFALILFAILFWYLWDDDKSVSDPTSKNNAQDLHSQKEVFTMRAILKSMGIAVFYVLFITVAFISFIYTVHSVGSWLLYDGSWVLAIVGIILLISLTAFYNCIDNYMAREQVCKAQVESLEKKQTHQAITLTKLINKQIDIDSAIEELNKL